MEQLQQLAILLLLCASFDITIEQLRMPTICMSLKSLFYSTVLNRKATLIVVFTYVGVHSFNDSNHGRHHQVVFCRCTSNWEREMCNSMLRFTDIGACPDCQQGGSLQLTCYRKVSTNAQSAAVGSKCCCLPESFSVRRTGHISPLHRDLHWVFVPGHVQFQWCVLAYRCLLGMAPPYVADDLYLTSADSNRRHLQSTESPTAD